MRAKRFQAATIAEAYEQVRLTLGDDAVIISTRQAVAPGMFGFGKREFVEVVAGIPEVPQSAMPARPLVQDAAAHDIVRGLAERAAARGSGLDIALPQESPYADQPLRALPRLDDEDERDADLAPPFVNSFAGIGRGGPFDVQERAATSRMTAPPPPPVEPAPIVPLPTFAPAASIEPLSAPMHADHELLATLVAGLDDVRALVERMALERAAAAIEGGPAALADVKSRLEDQGVAALVLVPVLDRCAAALAPNASAEATRQTVERRLAATLPQPISLDLAKRPATIFIVGPAGAGKTTAAVRLGMQFAQQGLRVTIAGTDVDRAGAPQQLQAYGAAAGLRIRICYTPGELQALIGEGESDVVIVDAPGHNGTRTDRMAELGAFTQVARDRHLLLTLPATMQADDLLRVTRAYASAKPSGLLLTRCDETETFGGLLSAIAQSRLGVAYTTHDESVGEPARPGDNHALASAVFRGRWPERAPLAVAGKRAG
ncbi:MAG: hypothetical protein WC211_10620 [Dehalococcoidia bacterium]